MAGRRIALVCAGEEVIGDYVARLAAGLADNGDRVAVVAPSGFAERFGLTDRGVKVATLPIPESADVVGDARAAWGLRPMLRGRAGTGPDVVHAFGTRAGLAASAVKVAGVPLVVSWWQDVAEPGPGVAERLRRLPAQLVARRADVSLCADTDLVAAVLRLGSSDTRLAPLRIGESVAAEASPGGSADPVEQADALYRELTGR